MAKRVASLYALLTLNDAEFRASMAANRTALSSFATNLNNLGASARTMGITLQSATAPVAAALRSGFDAAVDFDSAMANVNSILQLGTQDAAALRAEILAFGGNTRAGPQEVAEAYYRIVSAVGDASKHMSILENATALAESGQADLMDATAGLIGVMNSYGFAAEDATFVSDIFARAVARGDTNLTELASALPQVTGMSSSMNISLEDTAAALAYMTTQGITASNASSQLRNMMMTMLNPTASLQNAINALGFESGQAMVDALGLAGAYNAIREFGGGAFDGLITGQEALQGALKLTGADFAAFHTEFVGGMDGATDRARNFQNLAFADTLDRLGSKMDELSITAGNVLAPAITNLVDTAVIPAIDSVITWMNENPELASQLILITGLVVAAGPILIGLGLTIQAVSAIVGLFGLAWTGVKLIFATIAMPFGIVNSLITTMGTAAGITNVSLGALLITLGAVTAAALAAVAALRQVQIFQQQVSDASQYAQQSVRPWLESGQVTTDQVHQQARTSTRDVLRSEFGPLLGAFGVENVVADIFGPLFAGAVIGDFEERAGGGPVGAGQPYLVGEEGPELFIPSSSGQIVPNGSMSGVQIGNVTIYASDAEGGRAAARSFHEEFEMLVRQRG